MRFICLIAIALVLGNWGMVRAAVPKPTPQQLKWQENELACFIHYNIEIFTPLSQGCECWTTYSLPSLSDWNPSALDTDAWIRAGMDMGCKRFILTAMHQCGFALWNTSLANYTYGVSQTQTQIDIVSRFATSARKYNVGYGFYYQMGENAYVESCNGGKVEPWSRYTQQQYFQALLYQLNELWTKFGTLAELWFDGSHDPVIDPQLKKMVQSLQPNAIINYPFITTNPFRWAGTEWGNPGYPMWSTSILNITNGDYHGDPNASHWNPPESDFTLQRLDQWFYDWWVGVRPSSELISMYEATIGRNTMAIIDFAPQPDGSIPQDQMFTSHALGTFIRGCYESAPIVAANGTRKTSYTLIPPVAGTWFDRIVVQEDQSKGQLIRKFLINATLYSTNATVSLFANGSSVGHKFILVLPTPIQASSVTLYITQFVNEDGNAPYIKNFALRSCDSLLKNITAQWDASPHKKDRIGDKILSGIKEGLHLKRSRGENRFRRSRVIRRHS